jgi:hypothetical protein
MVRTGDVQAQPVPRKTIEVGIARAVQPGTKPAMPVIRLTDPALGVRSIMAQLASSKPGSAHTGESLIQGESPGENFHGPVSATAELPRVTTCAGASAAICAVQDEQTDNRASSKDKLIARMTARVPLGPIQSDNGLKGLRDNAPTRSDVRHYPTMDGEEFRDRLLVGSKNVATAHEAMLTQLQAGEDNAPSGQIARQAEEVSQCETCRRQVFRYEVRGAKMLM